MLNKHETHITTLQRKYSEPAWNVAGRILGHLGADEYTESFQETLHKEAC